MTQQSSSRRVSNVTETVGTVGSGIISERIISAPVTQRIHITGPFQAELTVDPALRDDICLRFRADDNVLPRVGAKLRDGVLSIGLEDGMYSDLSALKVSARVGPLSELVTSGRASASVHAVSGPRIALTAAHASVIRADGNAQRWDLSAAGQSLIRLRAVCAEQITVDACDASTVQLEGACAELCLSLHGAARLLAARPAFVAQRAQLELAGAARASLCTSERVAGRVRFPSRLRLACRGAIDLQGAYRLESLS
jgi:hypothetical protein